MIVATKKTRSANHPYPLMERPAMALALATISGAMNAWTLGNAGSFATVQSGNIVSAGFYGAQGDWGRVIPVLSSVLAFGVGAALSAIFITVVLRRDQMYSGWVLGFEAVVLAGCVALVSTEVVPAMPIALTVSFIAGLQGNAFHRDSGMLYGNTAVTFVVQMTFSLVGRAVVSRGVSDVNGNLRSAGIYGSVLLAFALGAAAGFGLDKLWAAGSLAAVSLTLAALAIVAVLERGMVDPQQNTPAP
ncbi:YoaK family protein [Microbacterium terregens]|uniref:YoaK family protein n=1 Tax=Microbacterium terregens TaxID=69363 RepID=A0ABV5T0I5_9MICO